jgi:YVTN family beta-propeller protein
VRRTLRGLAGTVLATGLLSCPSVSFPDQGVAPVSRSLALSADGTTLWAVNAESDSISQIDVATRTLVHEIPLASAPPAADPVTGRYEPAVRPRAIALVDSLAKAYVAAESASRIFVVDTQTSSVLRSIQVGAAPTAVVATPDGSAVYVVNHESATVQKIDTATDAVVGTVSVGQHPWGASLRADGSLLYVTQFLLDAAVTIIDTSTFSLASVTPLPDQPPDPSQNDLIPNGEVRTVYAAVPRPDDGEIWVLHQLLANQTPQPLLQFNTTAFPTITRLTPGGWNFDDRLMLAPSTPLTFGGAFSDVVSGFRDIAFTPDGTLALIADAQSEDVMVFDAAGGDEVQLVRPTPSSEIEGVVVDARGEHAYLQGRGSHNVTVLSIAEGTSAPVAVDGPPIECLAAGDPMPPNLRQGFRLFYSSNTSQFPITQNFWITCVTCHPEGETDAITWQFLEGPRDTPSNAGGPINTGFQYRQAVRNTVLQYDETIQFEQGGSYSRFDPTQLPDLQALADFVNYAIPFPQNPNLSPDGVLTPAQASGQQLFGTYCAGCHLGAYFTDSGFGNPSLDFSIPPLVHDIGTCVTSGPFPDQAFTDQDGQTGQACMFDTPTLRGIFATAPYLHDGSAATLDDAVARVVSGLIETADGGTAAEPVSAQQQSDLVAYLQTL